MPAHHLTGTPASPERPTWFHASVQFSDWAAAEEVAAEVIGPRLDALTAIAGCWWFLRKHPHWRIRIAGTGHAQAADLFSQLAADRVIDNWHQEIYEPEEYAFGGPAGMAIAHSLFCADTRGVLGYARISSPPIGRRELSILLTVAMLGAARLDWSEHGDVFARIAEMRPAPPENNRDKLTQLTAQLQVLVTAPATKLIGGIGLPPASMQWLSAFTDAGRELGEKASSGLLERGLRAVLAHLVIFHWNRLGLTAATQGILARAATAVYLPED